MYGQKKYGYLKLIERRGRRGGGRWGSGDGMGVIGGERGGRGFKFAVNSVF